jgi:hypothetical protein
MAGLQMSSNRRPTSRMRGTIAARVSEDLEARLEARRRELEESAAELGRRVTTGDVVRLALERYLATGEERVVEQRATSATSSPGRAKPYG